MASSYIMWFGSLQYTRAAVTLLLSRLHHVENDAMVTAQLLLTFRMVFKPQSWTQPKDNPTNSVSSPKTALKMEAEISSETSFIIYQSTRHTATVSYQIFSQHSW